MDKFTVITNREKPATVAQIAAIEFPGIKRLAALPRKTREKNIYNIANDAHMAAALALEILAMDKAELIEKVRANLKTFGPRLMELARARESAEILPSLIGSAEARLAVALAVIEGDDDPDPGDDQPNTVAA